MDSTGEEIDDTPLDLADFITARLDESSTLDRMRAIVSALPEGPVRSPEGYLPGDSIGRLISGMIDELIATYGTTTPFFLAPKTYEMLRFWWHFPESRRRLRKVQLRRIQARKRAWRKHRVRVRLIDGRSG